MLSFAKLSSMNLRYRDSPVNKCVTYDNLERVDTVDSNIF